LERQEPDWLVLSEVVADGPVSADAVLAVCRQWGAEESARRERPVRHVVLPLTPDGPVAAAAMRGAARFVGHYEACGGSMARVLDVERLLGALVPEFEVRLWAVRLAFRGLLRFVTDLGAAALAIDAGAVRLSTGDTGTADEVVTLRLPQAELARLALGAFPADDVLDRLPERPEPRPWQLACALFPQRCPHMYLPDRY
jgi:hypothetical protein